MFRLRKTLSGLCVCELIPFSSEENSRDASKCRRHSTKSAQHRTQLLRRPAQGQGGDVERCLGSEQYDHGGDRRSHVQRGGFHRNHADDLEETERSRKELASRLQGASFARVSDQNRFGKGRGTV